MDILLHLFQGEFGAYPVEDESNIIDVDFKEIPIEDKEGDMSSCK